MKINELMTTNPACCTPQTTAQEAARLMEENDCGCLPVVDEMESRHLVGVVTDRDLALRAVARGRSGETAIEELMTTEVACARAEEDVDTLQRLMSENQVRRVPVVDDHGCCVGIVAQADLALNDEATSDQLVGEVVENISRPNLA